MFVRIQKQFVGNSALPVLKETLYGTGCSRCGNTQNRMLCGTKILKSPLRYHTRPSRETIISPRKGAILSHEQAIHCEMKGFTRNSSSYVSPSGITFHFDTHKLVKMLEANGFSLEQAESLSSVFTEIVSTSLGNVTSNTVSKVEKEQLEMRFRSHVDSLRNDMIMLEKSEFARIKEENTQLRTKVTSLEGLLRDEVDKLKASFSLDFSLEKSRVKEEAAVQDQKIKDTHNRIETEIAKLGTQMESQKLDLIKYLVGSLLSCVTLGLAVWRFVKM